jgi:hypothetical protein
MSYANKTKVPVMQSRGQIEQLLSRHKCQQFGTAVDHDKGIARVQFKAYDRIVRFEVTMPRPGTRNYEQAERQRWRALLLVIKAKLESVESQIATFEEEFLAHIVLPNDQTVAAYVLPIVAEAYTQGTMPLLTDGRR